MAKPNLFIHCGTHKTATTSFQKICSENRLLLEKAGIYYPKLRKREKNRIRVRHQHSLIARSLSAKDTQCAEQYLYKFHHDLEYNGCHTILLSGEDFENILIDNILLENLINISGRLGFEGPTIAFVSRDPFEYFCSIYNELSNKKTILDFGMCAFAAKQTGYFCCPTNDTFGEGQHFNNFFAIDAKRLINRFSQKYRNLNVIHDSFDSFIHPWPGYNMLTQLTSPSHLEQMDVTTFDISQNTKLDDLQAEIAYTRNFLCLARTESSPLVEKISLDRLNKRRLLEPIFKKMFEDTLSD